MSLPPLHSAAMAVRLCYPLFFRQGTLTALGNRGGFSGAALWRLDSPAGPLCLRAWPPHETWPRLLFRHRLMTQARQHGLHFVPAIVNTLNGATGVEHSGRLWELTEWLPGRADFHELPSPARLEAACAAPAQLPTAWRSIPGETVISPAVRRRLDFLTEWHRLLHSGWHPLDAASRTDPLFPLLERAWRRLPGALEQLPRRLQRWTKTSQRLQ